MTAQESITASGQVKCPDCDATSVYLTRLNSIQIRIECYVCAWYVEITTMMFGGLHISTKKHPKGVEYT